MSFASEPVLSPRRSSVSSRGCSTARASRLSSCTIIFSGACADDEPLEASPDAAAGAPDASVPIDGGGRPASYLYGVDISGGPPSISRVKLDDQTVEKLVTFDDPAARLIYDLDPIDGELYYSGPTLREARRRTLATGEDVLLWTAPADIFVLEAAPSEDAIYVVLQDDPMNQLDSTSVYRVDLATATSRKIIEEIGFGFRDDDARGVAWYLRGSSLWRTRLSDEAHTLAFGGLFNSISELDLGPGGTLVTIPGGTPSIGALSREGRDPRILVADAVGGAFAHFMPAADPGSEALAWLQLAGPEAAFPDVVYAESAASAPRKLEVPFLVELRFDGISDAVAEPVEQGVPRPNGALVFSPCADAPDLECAELVVPIDHQNPGGDTATLPVRRRRALREDARLGVLVYDHGGPASSFLRQFMRNRYDDGIAGSGVALVEHFDIVGFERRGIEPASPRFACVPEVPYLPRRMRESI
jgi:hypothetical protein